MRSQAGIRRPDSAVQGQIPDMRALPQPRWPHTFRQTRTFYSEGLALFWVFAGILAALAALALAWPFLARVAPPASRAEHDVESFRAQLREVDSDLTRGVLTEAEAESARIELSRRLLAAAEAAERDTGAAPAPRKLAPVLGIATALAVPVIAFGVYAQIGLPDAKDRPLGKRDFAAEKAAARPSQEQAEATYETERPASPEPDAERTRMLGLIEQVKERLKESPDDLRGWTVLARSSKSLEQYGESWRAFAKVIELSPDLSDAVLYADMGEAMFMAAGGYISPQAEDAIDAALAIDGELHQALFFKNIALAQRGEIEAAREGWIAMLRTAPPGAKWIPQVQDNLRQASSELGVEPPTDLVPPGPTAAQRAAASEMSEEDRNAMIAGMVDGLAAKLEEDPNDLQGWLRLIRAYTVMGREDDAKAAQKTALETFADDADATARLKAAVE